jgi:nitrate/nitrite transporter NarK
MPDQNGEIPRLCPSLLDHRQKRQNELPSRSSAILGTGTGAVFALLARLVAPERVGAVTGVVGAAGGLGGFFPPLVMGLIYGALGNYMIGFLLLAVTAAAAGVFAATVVRRRAEQQAAADTSTVADPR